MDEFMQLVKRGEPIAAGTKEHEILVMYSNEAMKITFELNNHYHEPEEVRRLFSELTGKKVDDSFFCFPPFYTDFGKNISIGKNVFFNTGCSFQDRGGIMIGDGTQLGQNVILATLNHGISPDKRNITYPKPIIIGKNVWIGSGAIVVPGITIGDNAVIAAGAVVTKDVNENTVVAGVPAREVKQIER